ncbi:hypothetical protein [Cohnella herbarum]|uniref:Uncharacterized protein n=1 Tax=Cohnella herbarum TaxID=2728023 RepID=A0A7Z2VPE2_9BACL|nr:hypothetical protein [Cohnella herbarum]QJD86717.1 hypothetical protein HH215_28460 [Cohnella herbarum]
MASKEEVVIGASGGASSDIKKLNTELTRQMKMLQRLDNLTNTVQPKAGSKAASSSSYYDSTWVQTTNKVNEIMGKVLETVDETGKLTDVTHTTMEWGYNQRTEALNRVRQSRQASRLPGRTITQRDSSGKWWNDPAMKKVVDLSRKSEKVFKWAGYAGDAIELATTKPGKELHGAIGEMAGEFVGSLVGGAVGTLVPIPGATIVGAYLGSEAFGRVGKHIGTNFNNYVDWVNETSGMIRENVSNEWSSFQEKYNDFSGQAREKFIEIKGKVTENFDFAANQTKQYLADNLGIDIDKVSSRANDKFNEVKEIVGENLDYAADQTKQYLSDNIGINLDDIASRMNNKVNEVTEKVEESFNDAVDRTKAFFGFGGKKDKPEKTDKEPYKYSEAELKILNGPPKPLTLQDVKVQEWLHKQQNFPMYSSTMSPFPVLSNSSESAKQPSSPSPAPVNVSLPPGAIQLSLPGNELNYEELSAVLGEKLTAAIKQSLMNSNVAFNAGR